MRPISTFFLFQYCLSNAWFWVFVVGKTGRTPDVMESNSSTALTVYSHIRWPPLTCSRFKFTSGITTLFKVRSRLTFLRIRVSKLCSQHQCESIQTSFFIDFKRHLGNELFYNLGRIEHICDALKRGNLAPHYRHASLHTAGKMRLITILHEKLEAYSSSVKFPEISEKNYLRYNYLGQSCLVGNIAMKSSST